GRIAPVGAGGLPGCGTGAPAPGARRQCNASPRQPLPLLAGVTMLSRIPVVGEAVMQLDLQCQKCEESFSADVSDLSSDPILRCPSCGAHAPGEQVEALVGAMEDLFAVLTPVRRKFTVSVEVTSEELPPPYD